LLSNPLKHHQEVLPGDQVQARGGLVQQERPWIRRQRPGDEDASSLTCGHLFDSFAGKVPGVHQGECHVRSLSHCRSDPLMGEETMAREKAREDQIPPIPTASSIRHDDGLVQVC